jgi:hypothetical protein
MPRVLPKKPRFADDDVVRSWQSVSYDDELGGHTIKYGVRLRASHPTVRRRPDCFLLETEPDDQEPTPYAEVPVEAAMFDRPTKLRLKARILHGAVTYEPGATAVFPPRTAEWIVSENFGEVA